MQLRGVPVLHVVRSRNSAGKNSLAGREWEEEGGKEEYVASFVY